MKLKHPFKPAKKHKYGARAVVVRGRKYPSKLEGAFAESLWLAKDAGTVLFWLEQVTFHFKSGIKYLVDFQVFHKDGMVEFVEVKGRGVGADQVTLTVNEIRRANKPTGSTDKVRSVFSTNTSYTFPAEVLNRSPGLSHFFAIYQYLYAKPVYVALISS